MATQKNKGNNVSRRRKGALGRLLDTKERGYTTKGNKTDPDRVNAEIETLTKRLGGAL
jgi:hypothetical protein